VLRLAITALCGVGFYASLFMLRKSRLAQRRELAGPSIVEEPHARLFFSAPNSLFGSCYFPLLAAAVWIYPRLTFGDAALALRWAILVSVVAAGATSAFLAYSLLFITRRECPYCWSSHVVNGLLLFMVPVDVFGGGIGMLTMLAGAHSG
jgi:uncharacterized membrane protein